MCKWKRGEDFIACLDYYRYYFFNMMQKFDDGNFFLFKYMYILLHFRFWCICAEYAGLLHRYIHGNVICCLHPHHLYVAFLPMLALPNSLPHTVPPLAPEQIPGCDVPLPVSMCSHCSTPTYEWEHVFGFLFLCQFAENDVFQLHPCSCKGHELILFLWLDSILWCICAIFSLSSPSLMGIWVGFKSLLL